MLEPAAVAFILVRAAELIEMFLLGTKSESFAGQGER